MSDAARHAPSTGTRGALRQTWRLARSWYRAEPALAWGLTLAALALTGAQIAVAIRFSLWHRTTFDALEARDAAQFYGQIGPFALLIAGSMVFAVLRLWARQELAFRWRRWLVLRLQGALTASGRNYRMEVAGSAADAPDQRIGENTRWATSMAVDLALGLLHSLVLVASFGGILWSLSGLVPVFGQAVPGSLVAAALLYALLGAAVTWRIGRRMPAIHDERNAAEASHRFALVRLRENAEAIALVRGERDEERGLARAYAGVERAMRRLFRAERHLMWLGAGYMEVAAVLPLVLCAPRFLAGAVTLGLMMQTAQAFLEVVRGLSWFTDAWPRLADWRAHVDRVVELEQACEAADAAPAGGAIALEEAPADAAIRLEGLHVATACGTRLVAGVAAELRPGERVLITGESGCGKSTLFRAMAGIWPWGEGGIRVPARAESMFMPQRPYLPLGTLREALCYPGTPDAFCPAGMEAVLRACRLPDLVARLDEAARWDRILSLGEQQRLAFARLLLHRPRWVFMDEATSALDDATQEAMLGLVAERLPAAGVVSIGHRPGLAAHHDRVLRLLRGPEGARLQEKVAKPALPAEPARLRPGRGMRAAAARRAGRSLLNHRRIVPAPR